uniref:Uncharacterized protein n=1 Tax=Timema genevievae TaxID=629358 RepID=A0A7R9PN55_TIMGE|nr:unnamed protein product [Timema genevievae]
MPEPPNPSCVQPCADDSQTNFKYRSSKHPEVIVISLRVGHTFLTHGFPVCELCDAPLSVYHILVECRKYAPIRLALDFKVTFSYVLVDGPLRWTREMDPGDGLGRGPRGGILRSTGGGDYLWEGVPSRNSFGSNKFGVA